MILLNSNLSKNTVVKKQLANKINLLLRQSTVGAGFLYLISQSVVAATFNLPNGTDSLIDNSPNKPVYIKAKREDSLIDIAVQYLLGQEEIVLANKGVDRWLPGDGTEVRIPSSYLLPDAPRQGIVINLPEYRLYYYPPAKTASSSKTSSAPSFSLSTDSNLLTSSPKLNGKVISYSVGIGRVDWKTPLGLTKIVGKVKNPTWTPPATIKAEHLAKGDPLPDVWPAGPDNPLGLFAFRLALPGYLLHSTNKQQGVGMQVSHGCMRLYPKDIEKMFPMVEVGTSVNIVNQPIKVGWSQGQLYIESHPNLEGEETSYQQRLDTALGLIEKARSLVPVLVNDEALRIALEENSGIPTVISSGDSTPQTPENLNSNMALTPPTLEPALESADVLVPATTIEEELRQEEMQEREFKNSPIPRY